MCMDLLDIMCMDLLDIMCMDLLDIMCMDLLDIMCMDLLDIMCMDLLDIMCMDLLDIMCMDLLDIMCMDLLDIMCMDLLDIMYVVYHGFKILNQLKYHLTSVYNCTIYVGTSRSKISRPCVSVISDPFSSTLLIRHAISLSQHNQYTKSACNVH